VLALVNQILCAESIVTRTPAHECYCVLFLSFHAFSFAMKFDFTSQPFLCYVARRVSLLMGRISPFMFLLTNFPPLDLPHQHPFLLSYHVQFETFPSFEVSQSIHCNRSNINAAGKLRQRVRCVSVTGVLPFNIVGLDERGEFLEKWNGTQRTQMPRETVFPAS